MRLSPAKRTSAELRKQILGSDPRRSSAIGALQGGQWIPVPVSVDPALLGAHGAIDNFAQRGEREDPPKVALRVDSSAVKTQ